MVSAEALAVVSIDSNTAAVLIIAPLSLMLSSTLPFVSSPVDGPADASFGIRSGSFTLPSISSRISFSVLLYTGLSSSDLTSSDLPLSSSGISAGDSDTRDSNSSGLLLLIMLPLGSSTSPMTDIRFLACAAIDETLLAF